MASRLPCYHVVQPEEDEEHQEYESDHIWSLPGREPDCKSQNCGLSDTLLTVACVPGCHIRSGFPCPVQSLDTGRTFDANLRPGRLLCCRTHRASL